MNHNHHHVDGDDSDAESSLSDVLSPTDGYFAPSNQPRERFVPALGPASSSSSDASYAKQAEAQRESSTSSSSAGPAHRPSHAEYASRATTRTLGTAGRAETEPLLGGYEAPPPTYSAAISSSARPPPSRTSGQNSSTRPSEPVISPADGLTPSDPQSMRDIEPYDWEAAQSGERRSLWSKGIMLKLAIAAFGFVLLTWLLTASISGGKRTKEGNKSPVDEKQPDDSFYSDWPQQCNTASQSSHATFHFSDQNEFNLTELVASQNHERRIDYLDGRIRVSQGESTQKSDVKVDLFMAVSKPYVLTELRYYEQESGLTVKRPGIANRGSGDERLCLRAEIQVFMKPGLSLGKLDLHSQLLPTHIKEFDAKITELTTITAKVSSLHAELFDSRKTVIDVDAGSVHGDYALRDLLSITTKSGSIHATVYPRDANKDDVQPADLILDTKTGSAKIKTVADDLPDRDYRVKATSNVGSLSGNFVHGSKTSLTSNVGTIDVDLLPFSKSDKAETVLSTSSSTGRTGVVLLPPAREMPVIRSKHEAKFGSISLDYPQEWNGKIEGETSTGHVRVRGKDVRASRKSKTVFKGEKGEGKSSLEFKTFTGSADVVIGNK